MLSHFMESRARGLEEAATVVFRVFAKRHRVTGSMSTRTPAKTFSMHGEDTLSTGSN